MQKPKKHKRLKLCLNTELLEAGCDEAGRGCLAGPVYAAAVILPKEFRCPGLTDSKLLTYEQRTKMRSIIERKALAWAVAWACNNEIDAINILNASYLAMHRALDALKLRPEHVLIDGNRFKPYKSVPHSCIVKGDSKYLNIAAASVLAKTWRDEYMEGIAEQHPEFLWQQNKGYATLHHRQTLERLGHTVYHRRSFILKSSQLELFNADVADAYDLRVILPTETDG